MLDFLSAGLSFIGGERRNAAQEEMANAQMAFQERMSSTAHQREVDDLRKAGLNPMLSVKHGGSSSPSGAMANVEDTITPAVNTGFAAAQNKANVELLNAQATKARAEAAESSERTFGYAYERERQEAETDITRKRTPGAHYESEIRAEEFGRLHAIRRSLGLKEGSRLSRELGSHALLRDPVVAKYLMELPQLQSEIRLRRSVARLHELEEPRARNEARAQDTWWKREIAPFLRDSSDTLGSASRAFNLLR